MVSSIDLIEISMEIEEFLWKYRNFYANMANS